MSKTHNLAMTFIEKDAMTEERICSTRSDFMSSHRKLTIDWLWKFKSEEVDDWACSGGAAEIEGRGKNDLLAIGWF